MEYIKDRLNHEIRELQRENSILKESLYNKDREMFRLREQFIEADKVVRFLSVTLGVFIIMSMVSVVYVVNLLKGV